ncbi:6-phosphogluconolactonase [Rhizobium sp. S153]|uniref:6-phosphogluconolactonase n=1 Tax=Ciceribacter sichuanensis TaxID=2949647 RepID=A0ABT0VCE5_9HYPH|nr:6-phosphogluconolactonase [Ciceribacter sp. S153]MCM2403147.1 6-phosphogluconolactonase [Ciceribacter sp. S153]
MGYHMHAFESRPALAEGLANRVVKALDAAIELKGSATIAVSGGSTPKAFFEVLSGKPVEWDKVTITLVDERFVPADNARSNHLLLSTHLLKGPAAAARVLPLYHEAASIEDAAAIASDEANALGAPFDAVILGMGNDGHTASFFPGGDHLAEALDLALPRRVMTMEAEGAGEPRLTFSFSALHDARFLALHIEGAEKKAVLDKALAGRDENEMPIRAILGRSATKPDIYWAP